MKNYSSISPTILRIYEFQVTFGDMLIQAAPFSVDIFFLLSGTLTSLTILKQLKRTYVIRIIILLFGLGN